MKMRVFGTLRRDRGQSIVEFAFASTLFFMIVFGILWFGLAIWRYNMTADLAQEGARWASVRGSAATTPATSGSVQTFVQGRALGPTVTATTTWLGSLSPSNAPGNTVQVRVQQTFTLLVPFVPTASLTLHSTAQMIIAR